MRPIILVAFALLGLTSCRTAQLEQSTESGAAAVEPIYREQALANLAAMIDNPDGMPSQVLIQNGTMQANASVSPTVTFPLTSMFTTTVSSSPATTHSTAEAGASIGGSMGWQLNYVVQPMADIISLRNLRAQYEDIICNSPSRPKYCSESPLNKLEDYVPPRIYKGTDNKLILDQYYLRWPLCVRCVPPSRSADDILATQKDMNAALENASEYDGKQPWLSWTDGFQQTFPEYHYVGSVGSRRFYVKDRKAFSDFVISTLPLPTSLARYAPTYAPIKAPATSAEGNKPRGTRTPKVQTQGFPAAEQLQNELQDYRLVPGSTEAPAPERPPATSQGILPAPPQ